MKSLKTFETQILFFNGMYKLALAPCPMFDAQVKEIVDSGKMPESSFFTHIVAQRLKDFKNIILEEIQEVDEIIAKLESNTSLEIELDVLTDLADWLGDIQVYCASEMVRFGIPIKETTDIIMASNFSKLGEDSKPIYDERGKVLKGPGYWKPEPKIKEMLQNKINEHLMNSNNKVSKEKEE